MEVLRIESGSNGVIQLPPKLLAEMDFHEGQTIEIERDKNSLRVKLAVAERVKRAQALVRKHIPAEVSLVDDLIKERRSEAENE